jgi:hypothetical protein
LIGRCAPDRPRPGREARSSSIDRPRRITS